MCADVCTISSQKDWWLGNCKVSTVSFAIGSFQIEFLYHTRVEFILCVFSPVLAVLLVLPVHNVPKGKRYKVFVFLLNYFKADCVTVEES